MIYAFLALIWFVYKDSLDRRPEIPLWLKSLATAITPLMICVSGIVLRNRSKNTEQEKSESEIEIETAITCCKNCNCKNCKKKMETADNKENKKLKKQKTLTF